MVIFPKNLYKIIEKLPPKSLLKKPRLINSVAKPKLQVKFNDALIIVEIPLDGEITRNSEDEKNRPFTPGPEPRYVVCFYNLIFISYIII